MARKTLSHAQKARLQKVIQDLAPAIKPGKLDTQARIAAHINENSLMRCRNDAADIVLPVVTDAHVAGVIAALNADREVPILTPMQQSLRATPRQPRAEFSTALGELTRLVNKELERTPDAPYAALVNQLLVTLRTIPTAIRTAVAGTSAAPADAEAVSESDDAAMSDGEISVALAPTAPLLNQQNQPPRDRAHATNVGSHSVTALSAPPK